MTTTTLSPNNIDMKSQRVTLVALNTFFNIMHEWNISEAQQIELLGTPSPKVFKNWQNSIALTLNTDTLKRISYIIAIYKNLGLLFLKREQANDWVHKPNEAFEGKSALNLISSGHLNQMYHVVEYLNNQLT